MKAMVMAAGVGARLGPLTVRVPKPMVPVANVPVMERVLAGLRRHGITDVVANLWYLPECIAGYFGDGSRWGVRIAYSLEDTLRGTAGGVLAARGLLERSAGRARFVLVAGDVLTTIDIGRLVEFHVAKGAIATIALKPVPDPTGYGVALTDSDGRILEFQEKPGPGEACSTLANTMVYVLEPEVFDYIPAEGAPDFGRDVFPALVRERLPFFGLAVDEYWCDVGTIANYARANRDVLTGLCGVDIPGTQVAPGVWLGEGVRMEPGASLRGPVLVGERTRVGRGARIGPHSVIGADCVVGAGASVERAVVWSNTRIDEGSRLSDCVVGSDRYLQAGSAPGGGVVLTEERRVVEGVP